jgi:hypothetical protein
MPKHPTTGLGARYLDGDLYHCIPIVVLFLDEMVVLLDFSLLSTPNNNDACGQTAARQAAW